MLKQVSEMPIDTRFAATWEIDGVVCTLPFIYTRGELKNLSSNYPAPCDDGLVEIITNMDEFVISVSEYKAIEFGEVWQVLRYMQGNPGIKLHVHPNSNSDYVTMDAAGKYLRSKNGWSDSMFNDDDLMNTLAWYVRSEEDK